MVPEIYSKIILKLNDLTKEGKVNWKTTSVPDKFLVSFKDFSLAIWTSYDQNEQAEFTGFELIDPNGKVVDRFSVMDSNKEWGNVTAELYGGARRKALRIDEAVKIISKELGVDEDGDDVPF